MNAKLSDSVVELTSRGRRICAPGIFSVIRSELAPPRALCTAIYQTQFDSELTNSQFALFFNVWKHMPITNVKLRPTMKFAEASVWKQAASAALS